MLYVALLYSIGIPQGRLVMGDLRDLASRLGFGDPRTLVATGNLVFEADEGHWEQPLEAAYAERFGRHVDIIVRDAAHWRRTVAANPFGDGPNVMVRVQRDPLAPDAAARLEPYRAPGDAVAVAGGDMWVRFAGPPNESRLLRALTKPRLGIGTARIWNTVRRLGEMLDAERGFSPEETGRALR
jgi:uncharacterized protein (DUF1697 family)